MFTAAVLLSVLVGLLRRGRLSSLADFPFRQLPLVLIAFALQAGLGLAASRDVPLGFAGPAVHVATYALLLQVIWANRDTRGFLTTGVGFALNLAAIVVNGGRMPVSEAALVQAGLFDLAAALRAEASYTHTLITGTTRLAWAADVFALPPPFPRPTVFSLGDVVIVLGLFTIVQHLMVGQHRAAGEAAGMPDEPA